jgi:hypothetical protein
MFKNKPGLYPNAAETSCSVSNQGPAACLQSDGMLDRLPGYVVDLLKISKIFSDYETGSTPGGGKRRNPWMIPRRDP